MNDLQRKIINELQEGLPVVSRPYEALASKLGIEVSEVIETVKSLKEQGYIRRFGGIVDIKRLDVFSTLVGLSVEPAALESVASKLNEYKGITHNYEREDAYNLWFTLMEKDEKTIEEKLSKISEMDGVCDLLNLPAVKKYKTKAVFKL